MFFSPSMQPRDTRYLSLDDGRKLCLECLDSAVVDTLECQPLYFEIREFYEGLNMKVEQEIPLLLVERTALNEAMEGEKNVRLMYHGRQYLNFFFLFLFSFLTYLWSGSSSLARNQRALLVGRTNCYNSNFSLHKSCLNYCFVC